MVAALEPINVVIDTNVFISAVGLRSGVSWEVFVLLAKRRFRLAVTAEILSEYSSVAKRMAEGRGKLQGHDLATVVRLGTGTSCLLYSSPTGQTAQSRCG